MMLTVDSSRSPSVADDIPPDLLNALADHLIDTTIILPPSIEWQTRFRELMRGTPLDTQQRWIEYLKLRTVRVRASQTCAACGCDAAIGFVLSAADAMTCPSCSLSWHGPIQILASPELKRVRNRHFEGLSRADNCQTRLDEDFGILCKFADQIDVIDPFLVTDSMRAPGSSGFERLVGLAESNGVTRLRIITGVGGSFGGKELTANQLASEARSIAKAAGANRLGIHITVLSKADRMKLMHDRFVGFYWGSNGQLSWALGKGLGQFNGSRPRQEFTFSRQRDGLVSLLASQLTPSAIVARQLT